MEYRCVPHGVCSWDYRITSGETLVAQTSHDWMSERGSIEIGSRHLMVVKRGIITGAWSLMAGETTIAAGVKPSLLARRFELAMSGDEYELTGMPLSRRFDLTHRGSLIATIAPVHPLTRRGSIRADDTVAIELATFAFWLVVTSWRRAARQ